MVSAVKKFPDIEFQVRDGVYIYSLPPPKIRVLKAARQMIKKKEENYCVFRPFYQQ